MAPSFFLYLQSKVVGGSPRLRARMRYTSPSMVAFCASMALGLAFFATISRRISPSSRSLLFRMLPIAEVLLLELVSGIALLGTRPYLSTRLMKPAQVPPSSMGDKYY